MTKVLIVDDNQQNLYMLQALLEGNGYQVETATNGAEALEQARCDPPALIITDILMPVMDGFTLCRQWQQDERLREIPFVFYTATYTDPRDEEFALSLGAERFIVKPTEPDAFVDILREVIREAEGGKLRSPKKHVEEEPVYLRRYSDRLVKKLEDKMVQLERAKRRLNVLYQASIGLAAFRPLDELVPHILRTVVEALDFSNGSYFAYDEERQEFRLQEAVGFPDELVEAFRRELVLGLGEERGLVGLVGETREPLIVRDTQAEPRWVALDGSIRSALFVPVVHRGRLLGVANFLSPEVGAFDEEDMRNVMTLANNLGITIENAVLVEDLRRSEERYRSLFENVPTGLYRTAPTGEILDANPALVEMLGYPDRRSLLAANSADIFVHPEERQHEQALLEREGVVHGFEAQLRRYDGAVIWVRDTVQVVRNAEGQVLHYEGGLEDITAWKEAEAALRESEARFRRLAENAQDIIYRYRFTPQPGFEYVSPAATAITGYTPEEHYADPDLGFKLVHSDDRALLQQYFEGEGRFGESLTLRWVRKDGTVIWTEQRNVPVYDEAGNLVALEGIARDVTRRKQTEEALRESEAKFRTLAETAPAAIFIYQDTGFRYVTPAAEAMTGYTAEELLAMNFWDVVHPDFRDLIRTRGLARQRGETLPSRYEFKIVTKSGEERWLDFSAGRIEFEGQPAAIGTAYDITERKRAGDRLRTLHAVDRAVLGARSPREVADVALRHLRGTVLCSGAGVLTFDPAYQEAILFAALTDEEIEIEAGTCLPLTAAEAQIEILRQGEALIEGDIAALSQASSADQALLAAGICSYVVAPLLVRDELIGALALASGSPAAFTAEQAAIVREVANQIAVALHQARLSTALEAERHRLAATIEHVPEGILLLDTGRRVLLANPAALDSLSALAGARQGDVLTHLADRVLEDLLAPPPEGQWHELEIPGPPRRIFEMTSRPVTEVERQPEGWVLVLRDVTRQRETDRRVQQQERLATVGQLAAGIAHDFNNIMATVILYAQMTAQEQELPTHIRERMVTIDQQVQHATHLIRQILDFSRRSTLERRPMDLVPFLKEQVKLLERTLPEHIKVELTYGRGEHAVDADPTRMQQVVMNLAVNARDAMAEGGTLRIDLERVCVDSCEGAPLPEMEPGEWVRLTVSDTGTGIPPDVLSHIFEPFFTTKAPLGSGLGLAQVDGIVAQHGGRIDVETHVGEGTTFTIYLPALPVAEPEALPLEVEGPIRGRGETILVVEDDVAVRGALVGSLESLNYRTLEAADGREALAILERRVRDPAAGSGREVALVLSDAVMPEMGGVALLHALRQRGLEVPMVMLTGHPLQRELEELRALGLTDWLPKPPGLGQLAETVAWALSLSQTTGQDRDGPHGSPDRPPTRAGG
jgi:PAS domain S-box-containing protein